MKESDRMNDAVVNASLTLRQAYAKGEYCEPVRAGFADNALDKAYQIQQINTEFWISEGRRVVGRKIGLTSAAVQKQLSVNQPDSGVLFADMARLDSQDISITDVQQPKVEAEVAFILGSDLDQKQHTIAEVISAVEYVLPAIEIVGSRIRDWDVNIVDTIADNASSGLFILGNEPKKIHQLDMRLCGMAMFCRGEPVSVGAGAACMGNPLHALVWLADTMTNIGQPLKAGEVVLSGALGPMVPVVAGNIIEARISGLGSVRAAFSREGSET